jgi:hypothetical protein
METSLRVPRHTPEHVNQKILNNTINELEALGNNRSQIKDRLHKIESEWDIERVLETNAASVLLTSLFFGTVFNKKWLGLSGIVAGFLFQHAVSGWCPPVSVFRRLGFRTQREIDNERTILKARLGELPTENTPAPEAFRLLE